MLELHQPEDLASLLEWRDFGSEHPPVGQVDASVTPAPILDGTLAWLDCTIHAAHGTGDHVNVTVNR
jgi:flavin reductase (DIM6/NTAB) family NADH-FMN oxidoreductase RutF